MATLDELKEVLKQTLESKGVMNDLKANIRAEIFKSLDDEDAPKPQLTEENLVINELIREYLTYNHYKHTLSVFVPESGQGNTAIERPFLAHQLNLEETPDSRRVPLLYGIISYLQSNNNNLNNSSNRGSSDAQKINAAERDVEHHYHHSQQQPQQQPGAPSASMAFPKPESYDDPTPQPKPFVFTN